MVNCDSVYTIVPVTVVGVLCCTILIPPALTERKTTTRYVNPANLISQQLDYILHLYIRKVKCLNACLIETKNFLIKPLLLYRCDTCLQSANSIVYMIAIFTNLNSLREIENYCFGSFEIAVNAMETNFDLFFTEIVINVFIVHSLNYASSKLVQTKSYFPI